jgi:CheY-like chemotaxis protein
MPYDSKVIPIMRGRLVLVAERSAKAVSTGADALAFLTLHPDGVQGLLSDVGLPDLDGHTLTECALDLVPGLRVVMMIAPGDLAGQQPLPGSRVLPYLTKPVFRDRLGTTLAAVLGPPARDPSCFPSMGRPRPRRRPSGSTRS